MFVLPSLNFRKYLEAGFKESVLKENSNEFINLEYHVIYLNHQYKFQKINKPLTIFLFSLCFKRHIDKIRMCTWNFLD